MSERIKCLICGKEFKSLVSHLKVHNITTKEYKDKYKSEVVSDSVKDFMRDFMLSKNPFKGCKHSKETKQKMSGPRPNISGDKNPFKNKYESDPEFKKDFKNKHLALWDSRDSDWRKQFSEKLSKSMANSDKFNKSINKKHISHHWLSEKCENVGYLRSSWEILICSYMDVSDFVKRYEIESKIIEYYDYEKNMYRHTKVDFQVFFVSGESCLIEVKPKAMVDLCISKIQGIEQYCLENNKQFLIIADDCVTDELRIPKFLRGLNNGKYHLKQFIKRGSETPLCISSAFT